MRRYENEEEGNTRRQFVILHELGHICGKDNTRGNYLNREAIADEYARNLSISNK